MYSKYLLPSALFSARMSVPVISEGIRSGVNWILLNFILKTFAIVDIINVFAKPGTPSKRQCPLEIKAINICSTILS